MLKKSIKYLLIAFVNLIVLTALLVLWTDNLELIFDDWVRPIELLKILGFTFLSLIGMRLLVSYFRKRNIQGVKKRIELACLLTILISSYLYINYSVKIINNRFVNRQLRGTIVSKIKSANTMAYGTKAENLTIQEYRVISKTKRFPDVPKGATNIKYSYEYDGFLPDYLFTLEYDLPKQIKVDTFYFQKGDFMRSQTFTAIANKQRVTYMEAEQ